MDAEYEDKTDCSWYHYCLDPDHCFVNLPWLQVLIWPESLHMQMPD